MRIKFLGFVFTAFLFGAVEAQEIHGDLMIDQIWARTSVGAAKNGASYMTIVNHGSANDRLISAMSEVASRVELHTHSIEGGVMKMRKVDGVEIPAHGAAAFEPGGDHIMYLGLKAPFVVGERFPLTLTFETAGEIEIEILVMDHQQPDAQGHGQHDHQTK